MHKLSKGFATQLREEVERQAELHRLEMEQARENKREWKRYYRIRSSRSRRIQDDTLLPSQNGTGWGGLAALGYNDSEWN